MEAEKAGSLPGVGGGGVGGGLEELWLTLPAEVCRGASEVSLDALPSYSLLNPRSHPGSF